MSPRGSFGDELRARRIRARLTQRELAQRAGVSIRALRYIEQGKITQPRPESLRRLGEVVGLRLGPSEREPAWRVDRLWIGVLGRLEVGYEGRPVDGGTLKQRSLLGLLALQPNTVVSRTEIIDVLWGDDPPESCQNLVHTYVSRLRKLLEPVGPITAERGGYLLSVEADQLDLLRFDELAALAAQARERDPREAVRLLEEALSCWRGPLLADIPAGVRQHPVATAVSARRLAVTLDYADLSIELGLAGPNLVEQLRLLAREEPLHEGLHARLMLALAGSGQQAAALGLFTEIRRRLDDELGVEPGPEIKAAHLRIIQHSPAPDVVAQRPVPAQLPADVAGFAGRVDSLAALDRLVRADERGTAVVISAIAGTAGVGKTALAVHWAHRVRDRFPDGQLYINLRGYAPGAPVGPLEALTRFLRALGVPAERVPVDEEEAANLYRSRLADRAVLIVLDNAASAEQVRPLLPGSPGCLVVVTSRDRLTGLVAKEGAHRLTLDVLAPRDARELLASMLGAARVDAEPEAVADLGRMCAYLPLALRIAAANLITAPDKGIASSVAELRAHGRLNELTLDGQDDHSAVRAAFDLSYAKLEPLARKLFRLLGLNPGPDLTLDAAAALTGDPTADVRRRLGQLAAAHLVHQPTAGRYQLHDLLREYAAELAARDEDWPAAIERLYAYYLRTASAANRLLYPAALRPPATSTVDGLSEGGAIAWLEAERANLVAAAVQAAEHGVPSYSWLIADALRGYFVSRGHGADGVAVCEAALAAAKRAGDTEGEVSAQDVLGLIHSYLGDFRQAITCHTKALVLARGVGNDVAEASSLHNLGRACLHLGDPARAMRYHEQALVINRRIGNRHGEAITLNYMGSAALALGQPEAARTYTTRALRLARQIGARFVEVRSLNGLGIVHWAAHRSHEGTSTPCCWWAVDHYESADAYFGEALTLAREIGFSYGEASVLIGLSRVRRCTGRVAEAIAHCQEALDLMRDRGIRLFEGRALTELAYAHLELGDHVEAAAHAQRALEVVRHRKQRLIEARALQVLGQARQAVGDTDTARKHWRTALDIFTAIGAPEKRALHALLSA